MATKTPVNIGKLIHSRPDLHRGRPCLAGTGMTVHAIAACHLEGMSADQIQGEFPDLDLARIYAALAYYYANRESIDADFVADESLYDAVVARYPHGWTPETDRE